MILLATATLSASPVPGRERGRGRERGQSTVEFALIIPLVAIVLLLAVQVAVLAVAKIASVHVARDVARSMAIDPEFDPEIDLLGIDTFADTSNDLSLTVEIHPSPVSGHLEVCVRVRDNNPPIFATFAPFLRQAVLTSEAKMPLEI